jgi:hypothetical protein
VGVRAGRVRSSPWLVKGLASWWIRPSLLVTDAASSSCLEMIALCASSRASAKKVSSILRRLERAHRYRSPMLSE